MSSSDQTPSSKGKTTLEEIEKESHLQVTFAKQHATLFKKASELCTLTGAEVGIIAFSPDDKPCVFGHPDVDTIADRFVTQNTRPLSEANQLNEDKIKVEINLKEDHDKKKNSAQLFTVPINELNFEQLAQLYESYSKFKHDLSIEMQKCMSETTSSVEP
ncbi:Agamous-like MADS-box protein AGL61 [Abeliophyllum distichum]|uniref:Agamous-like MADS-box protein AGL61 n=1 Tax=Abeliophyllum distichum TaxID=126358 RepID=A0ABD1VZV7_9LAMI